MRADRAAVYYSSFEAKDSDDAFINEYAKGLPVVLQESVHGARRFLDGIGKHGSFNMTRPTWTQADQAPGHRLTSGTLASRTDFFVDV